MTFNEILVIIIASLIVIFPIVLKIIAKKNKKVSINCSSCCNGCPFVDKCNKK
ncbi:hypothetical protein LJC17_04285 [Acholeplasma sp. OttesenSCG-928-E16]|nr:hypothetical protein [Acholeplasma sp. OttesenSCG-928-E16]